MSEARYYGVSSGDGNNGVSHMHPDYIVKTDDPWRLAELAAVTSYKPEYQAWAKENVEIEGEAEFTISAVFHDSYETQQERDEMQALYDTLCEDAKGNADALENLAREIENFGCGYAEHIVEVFPWEGDLRQPVYESLEDAFTEADLRLVPATESV